MQNQPCRQGISVIWDLVCSHFTFLVPLSSFRLSNTKGIALLCLFSYVEQQLGTSQLWCGNADNTARWKAPACTDDAEVLRTTKRTNTMSWL